MPTVFSHSQNHTNKPCLLLRSCYGRARWGGTYTLTGHFFLETLTHLCSYPSVSRVYTEWDCGSKSLSNPQLSCFGASVFKITVKGVKPREIFCRCSWSTSKSVVFCMLRCFSAQRGCKKWLLSYCRLLTSSDQSDHSPVIWSHRWNKAFHPIDISLAFSHHSV